MTWVQIDLLDVLAAMERREPQDGRTAQELEGDDGGRNLHLRKSGLSQMEMGAMKRNETNERDFMTSGL